MTPISFSPWAMFLEANVVVQSVMIILFIGCLLSWTICIAKSIELFIVHKNLLTEQAELQKSGKIEQGQVSKKRCIAGAMIMAVLDEYNSSKGMTHDMTGLILTI